MFRILSSVQALFLSFAILLHLPFFVTAQQYVGVPVNNSLPDVPGSNITYFNVKDPAGKSATLLNYLSLNSSDQYLPGKAIKRLVVVIHGLQRDPETYMAQTLSALSLVPNSSVDIDNTQILCPYFPNGDDKNYGYPWTNGLAAGKGSTSNMTVWQASDWASGAENQYPYNRPNISSFLALDQILRWYDNKTVFPNVQQIVVAGHSLGGQMVQRYAAVGDVLSLKTPVSYWIANPDNLLWFSAERPLDTSTCSSYDDWRAGFSNYTNYYGSTVVAAGRNASLARYNSRRIAYARGTQDTGDDSSTCAPFTVGENRNERFFEFIQSFPPSSSATIDYAECGHSYPCMSEDPSGIARLFTDGFDGISTAYDYGCPRLQTGDDPFPDPTCGVTKPIEDAGVYNGYTYQGCYTDSSSQATLPYEVYDNANNTVATCTAACAAKGYTIAGMEYSTQCFCGNALAYSVFGPLVEASCSMTCGGNSSEICGDQNRLSIFSIGTPTVSVEPREPMTIGPYSYEGCFTEATSGRALSGSSTTSVSNMTAEYCVSFCDGYYFAGVEYSTQCYCGNTLNAGSVIANDTDCAMLCSGDSTEFCGGPNRLNLYMTNSTTMPTATSTITSATSTATGTATATLSCPASNGFVYNNTASGDGYLVQCYEDHSSGDLSNANTASLDGCIQLCDVTAGCIAASWVPGSPGPCYMKNVINAAVSNTGVWGFVLDTTAVASNSTTSTSTSTATATATSTSTSAAATATATSTLSCPASNGTVFAASNTTNFVVQCYVDHDGGDLSSVNSYSLDACIQTCANTASCVAVSYESGSPGPCYMKSSIQPGVSNTVVWGAVVTQVAAVTSTSSSSVATSTPSSIVTNTTTSLPSSTSSVSFTLNATTTTATLTSSVIANTTSISSFVPSNTSTVATSTAFNSSTSTSTTVISTTNSTISTSSSAFTTSTSASFTTSVISSTATTSFASTTSTASSPTSSTSSTSSTSTSTSTSTTGPTATPSLPANFTALGCYLDAPTRALPHLAYANSSNTPALCALTCRASGYAYSGTEYADECWCGSSLNTTTSTALAPSSCDMPCPGSANSSAAPCGGGWRLNVVQDEAYVPPVFVAPSAMGRWSLMACYIDAVANRTLQNIVAVTPGNMTVNSCLAACTTQGWAYCGMEYAQECWASMTAPSASLGISGGAIAGGCNYACNGNATQACGGSNRVQVYKSMVGTSL